MIKTILLEDANLATAAKYGLSKVCFDGFCALVTKKRFGALLLPALFITQAMGKAWEVKKALGKGNQAIAAKLKADG
jgi:hypothetical protein